jgi:hypothetical protein
MTEPNQPRAVHSLAELAGRLGTAGIGLAEILDSLAEAVTIRAPDHEIIFANQAAVEHMHFDSLEELKARGLDSIIANYILHDEHGNELTMADVPSVRQLAGETVEPLLMRTVHRPTGEAKWNLLKSTLLRDEAGEPIATIMIIEDVTREKTTELRARFLGAATETLMSSLDYQQTLRNVAWLAVPEIADWCAVDLIDDAGDRQQVVVAHIDPAKLELAEMLRTYDSDRPNPDQGLGPRPSHGRERALAGDHGRDARPGSDRRAAPRTPSRGRISLGARRAAPRAGANARRAHPRHGGVAAAL